MNRRSVLFFCFSGCFWGVVSLLTMVGEARAEEKEPTEAEKLFALKVQPLFQDRCLACHGDDEDKIESEFDLRSREAVLEGGEGFGGEVLVPGDPGESRLMDLVKREFDDLAMPPKESEKLTEEEIGWIEEWIEGGAPWPSEERVKQIYDKYADGVAVETSGGLSDEWTNRKYKTENLWAYQPYWEDEAGELKSVAKDAVLDWFIDQALEEAELKPAPRADRRTLIRRASYDLLGLPPNPKEVKAFMEDKRDDATAFAALVDRLLESPHYGEQWGRHWLDVVRYADSAGFANDWERPNAWRYRDYVIRAFNEDKPYDQFVREQIAGDELKPKDSEHLIAVGFLRMGPWEHTAMSVAKVTRQQFLDDVTDAVGQVFMAHALQCCRCHDHKFDPIPTRDYYSIQAVFATTQFADVDAPWLKSENREGMETDKKYLDKRVAANRALTAELNARRRANQEKWFKQKGLPYKTRDEAIKAGEKDNLPPLKAFKTPDDFGQERISRKWATRFAWQSDRYKPIAYSVYSGKSRAGKMSGRVKRGKPNAGRLEKTAILKGGSVFSPTEAVKPGTLSVVAIEGDPLPMTKEVAGRRRDFAIWLTDPRNPLTARVMVNRIWQYHFGKAIAGNPNNFGATGKKPTHPRLLDWLAQEFVKSGWSVKQMHRLIMNSKVYQRASQHPQPKELVEKDPQHSLYAKYEPRRVTAEELRDSMLVASGELNAMVGGIPNRPDMNLEAALQPRMIMGTFAPSYVPNPTRRARNRRSIYALRLRGLRDPFMETFNQPGPDKSCEIRDRSTVTPQALMLMNGDEAQDRALAFAVRAIKESGDKANRETVIDQVFKIAYGRTPSAEERTLVVDHWKIMEAKQAKIKFAAKKPPLTVLRRANEENTGEIFSFTERLFEFEDYEADLQPHEFDAKTRGLADVCLAVLNSNEFVYVY